jgi:glycosyltransferase involved in cell wall biosynthesis
MRTIDICLVIPTYNERENIVPLLGEIDAALTDVAWEALFVDDSTDGTDQLLADIAVGDPRVRLLHRVENRGGLAGAVVDGLGHANGTYVCVLDADLQHPPVKIPELLAEAEHTSADVVIASRYMAGGDAGGLDGPLRRIASYGLKRLSQLTFPRRLAGITDPLGGFFLFRRSLVQGVTLRPIGYKILLEILVRCPVSSVQELPYRFQARLHCESKADIRQGLRFLRHLGRLLWDCSPVTGFIPRAEPADAARAPALPALLSRDR